MTTDKKPPASLIDQVAGDPLLRAVLARFPGAEIIAIRFPKSNLSCNAQPHDVRRLPHSSAPASGVCAEDFAKK